MKRPLAAASVAAVVAVAAACPPALAELKGGGLPGTRVTASLLLHAGAGGDGAVTSGGIGESSPLLPSFGLGFHVDVPLADWLALGPLLRFASWQTEQIDALDVGRSTLWTFALVPRARLLHAEAPRGRLEIYAALPAGVSLAVLDDAWGPANGLGEVENGFGWNLGVWAGVRFHLLEPSRLSAFAELGWTRHAASAQAAHGVDVEVETSQVGLQLGVGFGL